MKRIACLIIPIVILLSCKTVPETAETPAPQEKTVPPEETLFPAEESEPAEEVFDPESISQELFDTTKTDVQRFIEELNDIIRVKDYNAWVSHLGETYISEKSSPEFLDKTSAVLMESKIQSRRRRLTSLQDYFLYVVAAAHQSRPNDRVDDIEFISPSRVKAFTITDKGRLRLYDLENAGNGWKIVN
jgi:hypothetical protein